MPSKLAKFIETAMYGIKPLINNLSLEMERAGQDVLARGELRRLPENLCVLRADVLREDGTDIPAEWFLPSGAPQEFAVLYFHGGAYMAGSLTSSRVLAVDFAQATGLNTLSFEYRLSPEHPYPAGIEDAKTVYLDLLKLGVCSSGVAFIGDSAGGGMACALMLKLRDEGLPLPGVCVAISPWTDLTLCGESYRAKEKIDPLLALSKLERAREYYAPEELLTHPYVSPAFGDFTGCPPTLIHVGSDEMLLDDARALEKAMLCAGVEVELDVWEGLWHVWHAFDIPETRDAMQRIASYILGRLKCGGVG
ncbi:MAG: alpha/beta hydrolase [Bacillota bacterium]